jgi:hypothetical protein
MAIDGLMGRWADKQDDQFAENFLQKTSCRKPQVRYPLLG